MASELSMNGRKKIETIKKEFNEKFEYLTLSFFDTNGIEFDQEKTLSEIRKTKGDDISIIASLKISSLEKKFVDEIGVKVEVSFIKGGQIIHTVEQNNLTLNELNEWCAQNGCEIIGNKLNTKSSNQSNTTIETKVAAMDDASLQRNLFNAFSQLFPDAEAKKIAEDNHLDIFIPSVYPKRGAHLYFNTAKDVIKVGYYCRDEEFVLKVLSNASNIESYANGIRILNNPAFSDPNSAVKAAKDFITDILNSLNSAATNTSPEIKIDPKPIVKEEKEEHKTNEEEVDLLAGFNEVKKTTPSRVEETKPTINKSIEVDKPEEEEAQDEEIIVPENEEDNSSAEEKSELSSLLSKIKITPEPDIQEPEEEQESVEEAPQESTESEEDSVDFSTLLSSLNKVDKEEPKIEKIETIEEKEEEEVKPISTPTPTTKKSALSAFDITNEATINKLCDRIKQERILPHLPYINSALEKENFVVDNHVANFFLSKVFISDQNMEGFLYVNMDGFHSNCIDKKVMQPIFSWSGVKDIRYREEGSNAMIDLIADQGELTIREEGTHALKVLHHIYLYAWKEANDKFANESVIIWNVVEDMGIKLNSYPTQEEYLK
jgi:hypothetical protein